MQKIAFIVSCLFLLSCGATKKEVAKKEENSFTIKENGNWKKGFVCGSELGLIRTDESNKEAAFFSVYIKEANQSLDNFVKHENDEIVRYYHDIEINVKKRETVNGVCYIVDRRFKKATISPDIDRQLYHYYKNGNKFYIVEYDTSLKYFDKYLAEAKQMMSTFKISKPETTESLSKE